MDIAPTLLIGVGGKGSNIVERIMQKMRGDHSKRIQCVVMDTDANDLAAIERRNPSLYTIQTSPDTTVAACLKSNEYARDEWFPRNHILESKSLTEGAGQVRAISRLALEQSIVTGKLQPLHDAISRLQLLGTDKFQQGVRVVVTGTIAGGTGSGLFLPLGLYLKNYLNNECNVSGVNIRGFFLLPDILANTVLKGNTDQQQNMRANAYAALRELDAFVARGDGEDLSRYPAVEFDIPRAGTDEREMYPPILPYDHSFLMDYQNANGKTLGGLDDYLQYAADTIYAFAISPMSQTSNSAEDNEIRRISNVADNGHCRYVGAGTAEICYPIDKVAEYVALQWAQESIGKEWIRIDKENEKRAERMKQEGEGFDEAREYITNFEGKAADPSNKFYVGLMRQAKGQIVADDRAEGELKDIELFPSLTQFMKDIDADVEDEYIDEDIDDQNVDGEFEDVDAVDAEKGNAASGDRSAIILKNDMSGQYIEALKQTAEEALERNGEYARTHHELIEKQVLLGYVEAGNASGVISDYMNAFTEYQKTVQRITPIIARQIASQLFTLTSPDDAFENMTKSSFLTWIRKPGSKNPTDLIHPSAIRYVAYKTMKEFESLSVDLQTRLDDIDRSIDETLKRDWDPNKDGHQTLQEAVLAITSASNESGKGPLAAISKMFGDGGRDDAAIQSKLSTYIVQPISTFADKAYLWAQMRIMIEVAKEALGFFNSLNSSYREFYRYIEMEIPRIKRRIAVIEDDEQLNSHTVEKDGRLGNSTRYVCADKTSLAAIMQKTSRITSADELEGDISAEIYRAVLAKAEHDRSAVREAGDEKERRVASFEERQRIDAARREERRAFFRDAYEQSVLGFWQCKVIDEYAGLIDVDVIEAIRNEAAYNGVLTPEDRDQYVENVLESAWTLSQIFLQQSVSPNSDRLKACLYDELLIDADDSNKMKLLKRLNDNGGKGTANLGRNRILFYQACYGIAIKDLDKFATPHNIARGDYLAKAASDGSEAGGLYYSAYSSLIRKLTDNLSQGSYISPHLDSRWHLAFQFPDIDEEEAERQRYNVYRAFVYALLFGKVTSRMTSSGMLYKKNVNGSVSTLTVRDGKCNDFWEIFEALMINNELVYYLLEDCEKSRKEDSATRSLGKSHLARNLRSEALGYRGDAGAAAWKGIDEFKIEAEALPGVEGITSVYEIPLFYEATRPAQAQHGDFIEEMLEALQDIVFDYLCCFKSLGEAYNIAALFYTEQYVRFLKTTEALLRERPELEYLDTFQKLKAKVDFWFNTNRSEISDGIVELWEKACSR
ncbi:MAG: hypothetical protein IJ087_21360 [Eggerthellaceae bacterium]|nr:hypothetical protein [Eggerthellaceae bacterium]